MLHCISNMFFCLQFPYTNMLWYMYIECKWYFQMFWPGQSYQIILNLTRSCFIIIIPLQYLSAWVEGRGKPSKMKPNLFFLFSSFPLFKCFKCSSRAWELLISTTMSPSWFQTNNCILFSLLFTRNCHFHFFFIRIFATISILFLEVSTSVWQN